MGALPGATRFPYTARIFQTPYLQLLRRPEDSFLELEGKIFAQMEPVGRASQLATKHVAEAEDVAENCLESR